MSKLVRKNVITVVVPCYNEQKTLAPYVEAMLQVQAELKDVRLELLIVDDGSTDQTLDTIKAISEEYPGLIEYISFSRNFGKEAGLYAGLQHAKGEYVAIMDADLQDPPHLLIEMFDRMQEDPSVDVVATRRTSRQGEPKIRTFFACLYYRLNNAISSIKLADGDRDYRLMRHYVVDAVVSMGEYSRFSKGIFSWVGYQVDYLEYPNIERIAGKSSWSFRALFDYAIDGLVSFSDFPLLITSYVGTASLIISVLLGIKLLFNFLFQTATDFSVLFISFLILFMGGIQLLGLGIAGKYIGKIFVEGKKRPIYITKEKSFFESKKSLQSELKGK